MADSNEARKLETGEKSSYMRSMLDTANSPARISFNPEEKTEIKLYAWLISNGYNVYLNRQSKKFQDFFKFSIFIVNGTQKKPDFVIHSPLTGGYYAIEIKSAEKGKNIRYSSKIIEYYEDYNSSTARYYINDQQIKISDFLVATENSMKGYLFDNEEMISNESSKEKIEAINRANIPQKEGIKSFELVRNLWVEWNKHEKNKEVGLGILIAEGEKPKAFTQLNKTRWIQVFKEL